MATTALDHPFDPDQPPIPLEMCGRALSAALAMFGGWAWLQAAGVWTGEMGPSSPGYVLLAVLSVVLQFSANFSAAAARRARAMRLRQSFQWSVGLVLAGGLYNAFAVHHAWEMTGLVGPMFPLTAQAVASNAPILVLSLVLAGFEPAIYWIDEALKGEAGRLSRQIDHAPRHSGGNIIPLPDRSAALASAAVAGLAVAAGSQAATQPLAPPSTVQFEPPGRTGPSVSGSQPVVMRSKAEERAIEMLLAGASQRSAARETRLSRHAVRELAKAVGLAEQLVG